MNTHTPGPWFLDQYGHVYGMSSPVKGDLGEMVSTSIHICTPVTHHEDRRLIAAAPELLEVLQSMFNEFGEFEYDIETLVKARDVLAKATGEKA